AFAFDEFWFIPSARPPHKPVDPSRATPEDRYRMVCLATEGHQTFRVSRAEIDRPGRSYAVDTVREFREQYGENAEFSWVLGADSLIDFEIWKDGDALLDMCQFVAVTRPEYDLARVPTQVREKAEFFTITGIGISSTDIRARVAEGRSIRYRTAAAVAAHIAERDLYRVAG
ncbi:nicotinate (nicotinamide) nucleotide adenylyltransferase, partial [Candidatus Poribacteria bacterium]|nr:nicotinate (nicotinamide) nucleotide adenylyltransferase [Candidatus Poribacteria bacterium]